MFYTWKRLWRPAR